MMKLRIRSSDARETLRIEVPFSCSLQHLKQILSHKFSSSSIPPHSIHLSLNRKDEIQSSAPEDETLETLGITSGDLVFLTFDHDVSYPETLAANSREPTSIVTGNSQNSNNTGNRLNSDLHLLVEGSYQSDFSTHLDSLSDQVVDDMELHAIDDGEEDNDDSAFEDVGNSFSAPGFLRKVFTKELGGEDDGCRNHKLMVIAVHAVLLESGFVGFDMNLKTEVNGFQFQKAWSLNAICGLSLFYTLPVLLSSEYDNEVVVLKFQNTGKFLKIYGSLENGFAIHSVSFNEDELVPFLNVAWANCGLGDEITTRDGNSLTSPGREVFNFWSTVKDNLTLPLLIDLCERTGLGLPPCFMRLPTDLKLKIFESLPGVDVAKIGCVSSELRYLLSSDDLWKQKFVEEFGTAESIDDRGNWKEKFARVWETRKRSNLVCRPPFCRVVRPRRVIDPVPRPPRWPRIIGGDYDIGPRIDPPFGAGSYGKFRYPSCNRMI